MRREKIRITKELILYFLVGVATTVVSIATYWISTRLLHLNYSISSVISWMLSVMFAYVMNKIVVFESKNRSFLQMVMFFVGRLFSLGIDISLMFALIEWICLPDMVAKIIVQVAVILINYVFSKYLVFKKK